MFQELKYMIGVSNVQHGGVVTPILVVLVWKSPQIYEANIV